MERLSGHFILLAGARRALAAFVAGAASALAMAPFHLFPVLFLTLPVFVWLLDSAATDPAHGVRAKFFRGFGPGWFAGFGYFLAGLWWIGAAMLVEADNFAWAIPFAVLALPAALAVFWGFAFGLARLFWREGWPRILVFSVFLSAAEYLRGTLFTGFPWNTLGLGAMPTPIAMQAVSLIGIHGVTLFALPVFSLAAALPARSSGARLFVAFLLLTGVAHLTFGWWRLSTLSPGETPGVKLRLVQPAIAQARKWSPEFSDQVLAELIRHSGGLQDPDALKGVTHLFWPESAFPFVLTERPDALAAIGALLPQDARLITGALRVEKPAAGGGQTRVFNSVYAIDDRGEIEGAADKRHLVPFGEYLPFQRLSETLGLTQLAHLNGGFEAGSGRPLLSAGRAGKFLALICYEIIFPGEVRDAGRPDFIVNVTNDAWFGMTPGPYQHWHQAVLRGVETGLAVVRVANNGISSVSDAGGRIVAKLALGQAGHIDAPLPRPAPATLYWKHGNLMFFGLLGAMFAFAIASARR